MKWGLFVTASATVLLAGAPAFADVQVTMQDGKVSVIAKDATLRQIMSEWARVGQTKVVNVERIPGGPLTLELKNVTEDQALEILMRPLSGYMAAPRALRSPNLSKFDRILVMPTVAAARAAATASSAPPPTFQAPPTFQPPPQAQPDDNDEQAQPQPQPGQVPPGRGPVFTAFPQPQTVNPNVVPGQGQTFVPPPGLTMPGAAVPQQQQPQQPVMAPSAVPTAPVGVAVPGMVVPMPQQPAPGQNPATVRRPGGL